MNIQEELRINGHQPAYGFAGTELDKFFEALIQKTGGHSSQGNIYFLLSQAYSYGVIQGKRSERARRKAAGHAEA